MEWGHWSDGGMKDPRDRNEKGEVCPQHISGRRGARAEQNEQDELGSLTTGPWSPTSARQDMDTNSLPGHVKACCGHETSLDDALTRVEGGGGHANSQRRREAEKFLRARNGVACKDWSGRASWVTTWFDG